MVPDERILIPKKNLFYACVMLAMLSRDLLDGYKEQEFADEDEKQVDQLALDAYVAGVIALLIDTLDNEANRELAIYCTKMAKIEYDGGYVFEPETRTIPVLSDCVSIPKQTLFNVFVELEQYDEFGDAFDPRMITKNIEFHAFLRAQIHGRMRLENARKDLLKYMSTQKGMVSEYAIFVAKEAECEIDIWIT